jgi:putative Holliday junction resolvase
MRVLAVDYGEVRIGVAISDALLLTAQNPSCIRGKSEAEAVEAILGLARSNDVSRIIIGLPKNMDGSVGEQARKVMQFGGVLAARFDGEVGYWDERLSTQAATKALLEGGIRRAKRKELSDGVAALILLQSYLDSLSLKEKKSGAEEESPR